MNTRYDDAPMDLQIADRQPESEPLHPERLAPHSAAAEEAVLGSILIDYGMMQSLTFLKPAHFFLKRHATIWAAMQALEARRDLIDLLTLSDELTSRGELDAVGGDVYLTRLTTLAGGYNAEAYGQLIQRAAIRRNMIAAASEIVRQAQSSAPIEEVIDKSLEVLAEAAQRPEKSTMITASQAMEMVYDAAIKAFENGSEPMALGTGYKAMDAMLGGGWKAEQLVIIAGRPGHRKSVFLGEEARHAAKAGAHVVFFGLEMSTVELFRRIASAELRIPSESLERGKMSDDQWSRFTSMLKTVATWDIEFEDAANLSMSQIGRRCRKIHARRPVHLVLVDYAQLVETPEFKGGQRVEAVSDITRRGKKLAKELQCPVLMAAQVSRECEKRQDKRPILGDLRESGSLEQDADIVVFVYDDSKYNENTEHPNETEAIIAKQRNGPTGTVRLRHSRTISRFDDAETKTLAAPGGRDEGNTYGF